MIQEEMSPSEKLPKQGTESRIADAVIYTMQG